MQRRLARQATGSPKPDIQQIIEQALGLLQAGRPERALHCLTARPQIASGNAFACYLSGLINVNLGRDDAALPFYDRALALQPNYTDAIEARARLLQRAGRLEEALMAYEALIRSKPAAALSAKAAILLDLNRSHEALEAYRALTYADPAGATAWYNCGSILAEHGEQAAAYEYFLQALGRDPRYGKAYYGAAVAAQKLGHPEEALTLCDKAPARLRFLVSARQYPLFALPGARGPGRLR